MCVTDFAAQGIFISKTPRVVTLTRTANTLLLEDAPQTHAIILDLQLFK